MTYNTDRAGTTLTDAEIADEAKRILNRMCGADLDGLTLAAREFIQQKLVELHSTNSVSCSVKQLFWLRDLSGKVD